MKNIIICSLLLYITLFKSYSQLKPDGTGTVNGYDIGPNVILGSSKPKSLSAGYYHNLAIRQDGSIIAKGWNAYSQSSIPRNIGAVTSVAGGYFHSLALTKEGTIVTWGRNNYKQRNCICTIHKCRTNIHSYFSNIFTNSIHKVTCPIIFIKSLS